MFLIKTQNNTAQTSFLASLKKDISGGWQVFGDCRPYSHCPDPCQGAPYASPWAPPRPPNPTQGGLGAQHLPSPKYTAMPWQPALLHFTPCLQNLLFFQLITLLLLMAGFSSISALTPCLRHRYPTHPVHHHPVPRSAGSPCLTPPVSRELGSKNIIIESVFRKSRLPKQEQ